MSKSTFKILFYIRKNQVNKEGKSGIMIRLTVNGEIVQFSSKLDVVPELWDVNTQRMAGNSLKARQLNSLLDDVRTTLKNHYHDIEVHEAYVTAEKVRNAFLGITSRQQTLLELFRSHNEDVKKLIGISKSAATYAKYDRCMRRLEEFMQTKYRIKDIALKEISHVFITDFENYLRTESGCNENTTAKFMQTFRMIVIVAKNNGWIFTDPFVNYKIRLKRVDRGYLTEHELQKILKKKFYLYPFGASTRCVHFRVFHGIGLYRRSESHKREHPYFVRWQAVDYDVPSKNRHGSECPSVESAAVHSEKI